MRSVCCIVTQFGRRELITTKLGTDLENRVNEYLQKHCSGAGKVTIRVLSSTKKVVKTKPRMKSRFCDTGKFPTEFPYCAKAIFAFEEIDGVDVLFFGMHVQEYGTNCPQPNSRYEWAHIWACLPSVGDDFIFNCHPTEQKIPDLKRLQDWYKTMLDKATKRGVVKQYKDIHLFASDCNLTSANELPYFEGDFWPNNHEKSIEQLDQEKEKRQKAAETAATASAQNKRRPRKNRKKSKNFPKQASNLKQKLYTSMEEHKESFFVIRLCDNPGQNTEPIQDPDSYISCDLMDGRDAFLVFAKGKHLEFSSLRRAKHSTMVILAELLHKQHKN